MNQGSNAKGRVLKLGSRRVRAILHSNDLGLLFDVPDLTSQHI